MSMTWHNELMEDIMMEEYHNDVWDIVLKLEIKNVVFSNWISKLKYVVDGSKARFVGKGFSQKEGIDYEETFAPVARYTSIRAIILYTSIRAIMALASMMKWDLHQMYVKTTFLNGVIEEVYIEQPKGFEVEDRWTHVCKLKKALYGLKQAPRT